MLLSFFRSASLFVLWIQVFLLSQRAEGLSCFTCEHRKNGDGATGCENNDLKAGHTNNRYSKACDHVKDGVCVKISVFVTGYYEERFDKTAMEKYYTELDKYAACRGAGQASESGDSSASGGETGTAASDAPGDGAAAGDATTAAPARRRRDTEDKCPKLPAFPPSETVRKNPELRHYYSCGNRSAWQAADLLNRCRATSDGVVYKTVCTCSTDLCNGAGGGRLPAAFLLLGVALARLQGIVG